MAPPDDAGLDNLQLAFGLAPVGLCLSRDRVIQRCNEAMATMFGFAARELEGRSFECLYPSHEEYEQIGALGLPIMQRSGTYSDERIMRRRNGELFWCHVAGRALSRERPFACAVWMFEDISSRRPVQWQLTAREREIARQLAAGRSTKQIARALALSPRTIDGHRARLMRKVGAASAGEMIARLVGLS